MDDDSLRLLWESSGGVAPEHWSFFSIRELLSDEKGIAVGVMYPGKSIEQGIPMVRVADVKDGNVSETPSYGITEAVDYEYRRTKLNGNELLITLVGNPGDCVVVSSEMRGWNVARALAVLRLKDSSLRTWIRSVLLSAPAKHLIDSRLNTTVQKTLNLKDIKELPIPIPPTKERSVIAGFVEDIDRKIELNRQINQTLEAMAQALFKSWFVDFDPVIDNALAAGNEIPEPLAAKAAARKALREQGADRVNKPHKLPEHTRQLFPSRFQFTEELGWTPEGWETNTLKSVTTELRRGISPKYVGEGGIRVINQKCIRDHLINMSPARRHDPSKKKVDGRLIIIGDVLVNSTGVGTLGRIAQVYSLDEPTVVDSHVTVVRPNTEVFKPYVFGRLMLSIERSVEALGMGSTGQTELSRADLGAHPVVTPPLEIQNWAEELIKRCADRISFNAKQSETLIASLDALLPKLLSGELRIPEAEKMLDEVLV